MKQRGEEIAAISQFVQLSDPALDYFREPVHFLRSVTGRAEGVANLVRRKLGQQLSHPFGVGARHMVADPA